MNHTPCCGMPALCESPCIHRHAPAPAPNAKPFDQAATYISGPISADTEERLAANKAAFYAAARTLEAQGRRAVNPCENGLDDAAPWVAHMRRDIVMLMGCDVIHMLPGWRDSRGARIEYDLASALQMRIEGAQQ